jgi:glycosyltransferase involved in cell wall biosynthesis
MNNSHLLTIAIPTYNRPQQLTKTIALLLPQLNHNCFLRVIDNHSDIPVETYVNPVLKDLDIKNYEIIRNNVNIGADSNIIRCFEYCETRWLWTLGDDDEIVPNAVDIILNDITKYPEAAFINYCSPSYNRPTRTITKIGYGKEDFLKNIDSFGATIYMSCNVYQMKYILKESYSVANHNTYSCVSQWLILFQSLTPQIKTVITNEIICLNPVKPTGGETNNISVAFGVSTLLDMILPFHQKKLLIDCLRRDLNRLVSLESAFRVTTVQFMNTKEKNWIFLFKRLYYNYYRYFGLKIQIKFFIYYTCLILSPTFTFRIINYLYIKKSK